MTLRSDNADLRLTCKAKDAGVISDARWNALMSTKRLLITAKDELRGHELSPQVIVNCLPLFNSKHSLS